MNDQRSETEIRYERRKDKDEQSEKDHRKALLLLMGDKVMKLEVKNKMKYGCVTSIYNEFKQRYKWLTKKQVRYAAEKCAQRQATKVSTQHLTEDPRLELQSGLKETLGAEAGVGGKVSIHFRYPPRSCNDLHCNS